jgi:hypothetical protein
MVPGAFFGFKYTDRHITQNLPVNSTVISVSVQRLLNDIHMAGLACDTDRRSSMIRMLKKSTSFLEG